MFSSIYRSFRNFDWRITYIYEALMRGAPKTGVDDNNWLKILHNLTKFTDGKVTTNQYWLINFEYTHTHYMVVSIHY